MKFLKNLRYITSNVFQDVSFSKKRPNSEIFKPINLFNRLFTNELFDVNILIKFMLDKPVITSSAIGFSAAVLDYGTGGALFDNMYFSQLSVAYLQELIVVKFCLSDTYIVNNYTEIERFKSDLKLSMLGSSYPNLVTDINTTNNFPNSVLSRQHLDCSSKSNIEVMINIQQAVNGTRPPVEYLSKIKTTLHEAVAVQLLQGLGNFKEFADSLEYYSNLSSNLLLETVSDSNNNFKYIAQYIKPEPIIELINLKNNELENAFLESPTLSLSFYDNYEVIQESFKLVDTTNLSQKDLDMLTKLKNIAEIGYKVGASFTK